MKPTAVVTGAAGFIGSHLVTRLLRAGCAVRMVDNLSTGRRENLSAALAEPGAEENSEFIELDVSDPAADRILTRVCRDARYVFHLAALADIVPSIERPMEYHRSNVEGTVRVLEAARKADRLGKFVFAASSSGYGIPAQYPTPESAPINPEYPYALTKAVAEQYVMHWSKVYGLPFVSLRFFNVYGPRSRSRGTYGAVFGVFLAQKRAGAPLTVVGDGSQTRDFVYVTDLVEACLMAAESPVANQVYNVGAGNPVSINRLCELIGGPTVHVPSRPGEPDCTWADVSRIRRDLGWSPRVSIEEGTRHLLSDLDSWGDATVWTPEGIAQATAGWFRCLDRSSHHAPVSKEDPVDQLHDSRTAATIR